MTGGPKSQEKEACAMLNKNQDLCKPKSIFPKIFGSLELAGYVTESQAPSLSAQREQRRPLESGRKQRSEYSF